ncbi:hypothetical protein GCK72_012915 [Caenorhabditis remanei]|uniref:CUT domain-containing protein n=1 Tax=Caenorhabditis remanei TaxID=31234 RepID=A0A6A5GQ05_CAERE|nr:hypothetical protein GCK72_012915 [Caenorhabditis remanei]KAF1756462.1 hypothetical protein GCK72_012915 [Caenorhabditis remanei]
MIPTRALSVQQTIDESNYILAELTNVRHPRNTDCYGILKRKEVPISCFEREMVKKENRFEMRYTPYGSKDLPIYFMFSDENQSPNEFEPATKRMKLEDYSLVISLEQQMAVDSFSGQERRVTRELNNAVLNFNCPMPSSSLTDTFSPVASSPSTSSRPRSMSAKQAHELLSTPIPDNVYLDTKDIARQMREWFTLAICSQSFFAAHVLGTVRNRLHRVLTIPRPFDSLKTGKELFIKMYNWLKLSEDVKKEILSIFEIDNEKPKKFMRGPEDLGSFSDEYDYPKLVSRKRQVSLQSEASSDSGVSTMSTRSSCHSSISTQMFETIEEGYDFTQSLTSSVSGSSLSPESSFHTSVTTETFNDLINKPVNYVDTKRISVVVKNWLERTQATQEWFATKILKRCRRTLNQCLNNPKDWKELSQKREIYVKMHNWMCLAEEQRHEMMRIYNAPNMDSQ